MRIFVRIFVCIACCMHLKRSYCLCNVCLLSTCVRIVSAMQFVNEENLSNRSRRLLEREKHFSWWLSRYRGEISVSDVLSTTSRHFRILKELHSLLERFVGWKWKSATAFWKVIIEVKNFIRLNCEHLVNP